MRAIASTLSVLCLTLSLSPAHSYACAVCFGPADKQTGDAITRAILFLIGVTALVLTGVTVLVVRAVKRARAIDTESPIETPPT